ncbi:Mov34/MPN/PAD-1 family protein [Morganella morganii]|uniref:Mov34/MPN/PAD-1 family protein n=1 Tax=Morganella morganii TaxID=582 RepID=UPI0018982A08|nr:Mov34/MPN/PAD-1 family protein [Morganella morganii]
MLRRLSSDHMVWQTKAGVEGAISPQVISMLAQWKQRNFLSKEAGGLILGFLDKETNGLLAESLTVPGRGDKRSRTGFFRSDRHQIEAEQWNRSTNGRGTQLGLWHTHPEPNPTPSGVDLSDCHNVLRTGSFPSEGLLYLIVGTCTIGCWYAQREEELMLLGYFKP